MTIVTALRNHTIKFRTHWSKSCSSRLLEMSLWHTNYGL